MSGGGESGSEVSKGRAPGTSAGTEETDTRLAQVARWLRATMDEPAPPPNPDLIERTLMRVQRLILLGDLLRFGTLEAFWRRRATGCGDAGTEKERHTPS